MCYKYQVKTRYKCMLLSLIQINQIVVRLKDFYKTISNYNYLSQSFHHTLVLANKTLIYHLQLAISSFQVAYDTQYHETAGLTSYYT